MKRSAGILLFRRTTQLEVLLGHMGGPFWARKDAGAWSVPKGEYTDDETPEQAARREFEEELGLPVPDGELIELGEAKGSGKVITVWALDGDLDPETVTPGTFEMEWPPKSGQKKNVPRGRPRAVVQRGRGEREDRLRATPLPRTSHGQIDATHSGWSMNGLRLCW